MSGAAPELLEDIASRLVRLAGERGASGAEATAAEGSEFECRVRLGETETLKEAASRAAGIRVLKGKCTGSAYTSDLTEAGLRRMVEQAMELASISTADPFAGLPDADELGALKGELALYSPSIDGLDTTARIELARRAEKAALDHDPRIRNSEGGEFSAYAGTRAFANSLGFVGSYRSSTCSLSVIPVAEQDGRRERDSWSHRARSVERLESPESIGREAARRAVLRLGARKVETQTAPVVFEPRTARSIAGHLFSAVSGAAVWQKATFLYERMGERIGPAWLSVMDDGTMPGLFGTSPFDDEGVLPRAKTVIGEGVLSSWLLNSYTARKLGLRTTGNASRGITGNAGTGHGNLYIAAGRQTPEEITGSIKSGFLVTELLGSGVNIVNGDYSRGAAGVWIENGKPAWPVSEVTIAGNLARMIESLEAAGNDLEFRGSIASPTLLFGEMTISGR